EGEETEDDVRIYRDPITGKNNYAKVKDYAEWKDMQYEKYGESKVTAEQKKIRNKASDKIQFEKYRRELGSLVPSKFDEFQEIKYNDNETWEKLSYNYKLETIYNLDKLKHTENFTSIKAIKHILEGEINRRGKAVGFHMENMPTRKGNIIENTRSGVDENGIYKAKVVIKGIRKQAQSSFFPTKMIPQQIIDAINEAYNRKDKISENKYSGKTSYGFEIIMYLDSNDKIITAYPIKL
ncbi:MAG: EndoU domain-containing protein, partial [Clostridium sp.]|uniref:EndoU domain-containing protein n=1 Tax=Clostridium sp. TaxID=1506 RepID=UPI0029034FB6